MSSKLVVKRILVYTIPILAIGILIAQPAYAQNKPKFVTFDFYPFAQFRADKIIGLFPELMNAIETLSGVSVTTTLDPIPRAIRSIATSQNDLIITAASSPAFKQTISLGSMGCSRTIVVTNDKSQITRQADLKGKNIGFVTSGYLFKKYGDKFGIVPVQTSSSESMFRMLVRYRVDGIFISDLVFGSYRTEGAPFSQIPSNWHQRIGTAVETDKSLVRLIMPKASKFNYLGPKISEAIKLGNANGQFERIFRKYGSDTGGRC
jgi:ABC-type amino acid transport substrate-binding protein